MSQISDISSIPDIAKPVLVVLASAQRRGAEIQGTAMANWLHTRGHRANVVALAPGGGDPLDVEILGSVAKSVRTLRALRQRVRGSVVVAHGSDTLPMVALASPGMNVTWIYRSVGDPRAWTTGPVQRVRTGAFLSRADHVVALWDGAAASMTELYRVPPRKLSVIANHRSSARFPRVSDAERIGARAALGVDGPVVAYLGALSEEKRPLDAVKAMAYLPGATLVVAGRGPLHEEMRDLAARVAEGRVRLLGESNEPASILAAADVVVLPSRTEGMPGVIIESMLRGVPVVATSVGAVPSMVTDGVNGFVVAPGDPIGLARALGVVLADPARFRPAPWQGDDEAPLKAWEGLLSRLAAT